MENSTQTQESSRLLDTANSSNTDNTSHANESCSVLVKNLGARPDIEKTLGEFFSFCGTIAALSIVPDLHDPTLVSAVVTFNDSNAAKTAVLLTNTQINERNVSVELVDVPTNPSMDTSSQQASVLPPKGTVEVLAGITNELAGATLGAARAIDEQIHVTEAFGNVVSGFEEQVKSLDSEYHVSEKGAEIVNTLTDKAHELDATYHISDQAHAVGESIKESLQKLDENHQLTQKMNDVTEVAVSGVISGAKQVNEFLQTNETAKNATEFVNDVSVQLGSALNGLWSSMTQPAPVSHPSAQPSTPQMNVTSGSSNTI